jgi:hypothetical protein
MSDESYDLVVIGTGPGGEGAAMQAVKLGKHVAAIERYHKIGGSCTHRGTIPSKALRHAIFQLTSLLHNKLFRQAGLTHIPDFPELRRSSASVIEKQVDMRLNFYERNGVPIYYGHARLIDPHTVEVVDQYGGRRRLRANCIVLSTGARPHRPKDIDFTHPNIFDSDTILDLARTPRSVLIYGAGVIGCEYASMFRNLGVKVNLINSREKLLEFLDDEIIDALSYHLRDNGVLPSPSVRDASGMVEVFEETMEPGLRTCCNRAYSSRLAPGRSTMASTIQSQSASSGRSVSRSPACTSRAAPRCMKGAGSARSMRSTALAAPPGTMSSSTTGRPALATCAAMPAPITPAPTTPTLRMATPASLGAWTAAAPWMARASVSSIGAPVVSPIIPPPAPWRCPGRHRCTALPGRSGRPRAPGAAPPCR